MPPIRTIRSRRRQKTRAKSQDLSRSRIKVTPRDRAAGKWFEKLVALQARLRGANGCPWDREQTHDSLRKFLIEETYEVLDAMDSGDPAKFYSELGDLLLQVVFHSILAEETGAFTISDVIESVHTKMVRRHPHVFGTVKATNSAAVLKNWEQIKAEERAENRAEDRAKKGADKKGNAESILDGVPRSLPSVLEAYQLTRRASYIGFDWETFGGVLDKLEEEKQEIEAVLKSAAAKPKLNLTQADAGQVDTNQVPSHLEQEVGDLLFVGVNIARFLGVDPEIALKKANRKFKRRFQWMESAAAREGHRFADLARARMEELWNLSKAAEAK